MKRVLFFLSFILFIVKPVYGQSGFGFSLKGGTVIPVGEFADDFNVGYSFEGSVFYNVSSEDQIYLGSGYQRFGFSDEKTIKMFNHDNPGATLEVDLPLTVVPFIFGAKHYFSTGDVLPFALLEFGYYIYSGNVEGKIITADEVTSINEDKSGYRMAYNFGAGFDLNLSGNTEFSFLAKYSFAVYYDLVEINQFEKSLKLKASQYLSFLVGINYYIGTN